MIGGYPLRANRPLIVSPIDSLSDSAWTQFPPPSHLGNSSRFIRIFGPNGSHGGRYSHSYTEALPDFVKLAEAYHAHGIRCEHPGDLDEKINEMLEVKKPVLFDCVVDPAENCFPMIPSGRAHNEMLLGDATTRVEDAITEEGKVMV